ncbi:AAA family ATPase [Bernardetia sp. OM2101]|uniref:AAA family ATPase n=1 Tax=Bernardetia sp. OM2101 TaxID=3344876 RepID=UPI0035CF14A6
MNEEDNNIENTEKFKTVVVAQDGSGDYESIEQALFFEESQQDLTILVEKGYYKVEIIVNRVGVTHIIGEKGVVFSNLKSNSFSVISIKSGVLNISNIRFEERSVLKNFIHIESDRGIGIHKCIFKNKLSLNAAIQVNNVSVISITDCVFQLEAITSLLKLKKSKTIFLMNNTIISTDKIVSIEKEHSFSKILLSKNIIVEVSYLFELVNTPIETVRDVLFFLFENKKIVFERNIKKVDDRGESVFFNMSTVDTNILQTEFSFKNQEERDYRIEDPRYKGFGASEETILFFMDNEVENQTHKPRLSTKEILIYTDTSLFKKEFENFIQKLKKESEIKNIISIHSVKELQEQKAISTLVLVSPVDKSENDNEIFEILEEAKKQKKQIFIFLADIKKHTGDKMNIAKMPQVLETHNKLREEENVSFYENTEQLEEIIYQRLQTNFPNVTLEKLVLKNIGHFSDLKIDFEESNQNAYCFIGTNGTGKTSILRAIILGLIGISSKSLELDKLNSLVKIYGLENGIIQRENAFIELHYLIDNKKEYNKVSCLVAKDGKLEWKEEGDFALLDESFLESLIIGFSQLRGERGTNGNKETNRQLRPHVSDLLPLVHNEVDGRLSNFSRWIIDLYAKANEKEVRINRQENSTKKETEILERTTINLVFEIVSQLLDQKIKFKEVRENSEVWVCTELAENGIPISLVSQGFNTIIGWIGGLLQRMQEVYGLHALGRKKDFQTYPAFCLIDELDPHLHPQVQANLMNVLNKYFPNTLFVFSTHSPLIIPYLEKENVFMLTENGQVSNAHIHTKGRSYQSILLDFMNVAERPKEYAQKLDDLYRLIDDENIEEANKKLAELIKDFGENDPEILRAQTMIDFIED